MKTQAFIDEYTDHAKQVVAFHGQLFPGMYPTDETTYAKLRGAGSNIVPVEIIDGPYAQRLRRRRAAIRSSRLIMQRLRVLPAPDHPLYYPQYKPAEDTIMQYYTNLGEVRRTVTYSEQLIGELKDWCGADSPLVNSYLQGIQDNDPHSSVWHIRHDQQTTIGIMNYRNREFQGVEVHDAPGIPSDVERYAAFWLHVFDQAT